MPPLLIGAVVAVGASVGAAVVSAKIQASAAEKEGKKQRDLTENLTAQDRALSKSAEDKRLALDTQNLAENVKLAEQQLILDAGRQKLETLTTLESFKNRNRAVVVNAAPQPIRQMSFLDRINLFIQGLF